MSNFKGTRILLSESDQAWNELEDLLKGWDKYHSYADDYRAYQKGEEQSKKITALVAVLRNKDPERMKALADKYGLEYNRKHVEHPVPELSKDMQDFITARDLIGGWLYDYVRGQHQSTWHKNVAAIEKIYKKLPGPLQRQVDADIRVKSGRRDVDMAELLKIMKGDQ